MGSEKAIGERKLPAEFNIDTKANTGVFPGSGRNILESAKESFADLGVDKVSQTSYLYIPWEVRCVVRHYRF